MTALFSRPKTPPVQPVVEPAEPTAQDRADLSRRQRSYGFQETILSSMMGQSRKLGGGA